MARASDVTTRVGAAISADYLRSVVELLTAIGSHPLGFRVAGTPEEHAAVDLVSSELERYGYEPVREAVPVDAWRLLEANVELEGGRRFECASFGGVPETGSKGVSGRLVDVGRGGRRQLEDVDIGGAIALVDWQDEDLWPYQVGLELGLRGAAAMVVTSRPGGPYYQSPDALGSFDGIWHAEGPPAVTIRKEDAMRLAEHVGSSVRVVLSAPLERDASGFNVTATLQGREDIGPLLVGGHHDAWFRGAFDDASAVAMTVALARAFVETGVEPRHPIVFISHTAEEYGVTNSSYDWCTGAWYQIVAEHREWSTDAAFYLNLEGCGRPQPFVIDAPPELARWAHRLGRHAEREGDLPHGWKVADPTTWTEVWPFLAAGVPGVNVSTFSDEFDRTDYHTQLDTVEAVDFVYLAALTRVCAGLLLAADAEADTFLDFRHRALHLRRRLRGTAHKPLESALATLERASGRAAFTAAGRGFHGLDAKETAAYPHEQTAKDVRLLDEALAALRRRRNAIAARRLAGVGLNWLCADLSHEAFVLERTRRGRRAPRACWAAQGDPDIGPDLWRELASLRREPGARPPGAWLERRLSRHLQRSRRELARRLDRMAAAAGGRTPRLARVDSGSWGR
jgi:Iap family predicted aminopeptidase